MPRTTPAVWAICAHVLVGLICAPGLLRLETSADTRVFYGDNVYHQDLKNFEATFQQNNNILLLLRFDDQPLPESAPFAAAIRAATASGWRLPYVLRAESLATHPHVSADDGAFELVPVLDLLCPSVCEPEHASLLNDPVLQGRLISTDLTTAGVYLAFDLPYASPTAVQAITDAVRALASQLRTDFPGLRVEFVGSITMMDAFNEAAERDASLLVPLVLLVMSLVLVVLIGELKLVALLLATGAYGSIVAMGVAGWLGIQLNPATSVTAVIVITLTVAGGLHLMISFLRQRLRADVPGAVAVRIAVDLNWRPVLLTTATTLLGMLSMNFADSPPLGQLGNLVSIGLVAATSALLLVVPVVLGRIRRISLVTTNDLLPRAIRWVANRRGQGLAIAVAIAMATAVAGVSRISLNDDFVEYFDQSFEFRRAADFAQAHLGGPNYVDIELRSNAPDGIFDPRYIALVGELTQWLREQPLVANAVSVADVVEDLSEAFTGSRDVSGLTREEVAQFILTYELSLTAGQDLEDFLDKTRATTRLSTLLSGGDSKTVIELESAIYAWFAAHSPAEYSVVVTGINVPVAHTSILNARSMLISLLTSLGLISVILGIYFGSFRIVLLTVPAIFLPSRWASDCGGWRGRRDWTARHR
ncbi:MAG: MMPL family transporter [Gammaproteobacteria bacterium]|nr:MMPL family transporter [Gammaproteobacteria bacterium]